MRKYEKPEAMLIDEVTEGVYTASGESSSDCWTVSAMSCQDWNGSHHVFEISGKHSTAAEHISSNTRVVLTFSSPVTNAYSENGWSCSVSGNTVTVDRPQHANGYKSGDNLPGYKVWVQCSDEATTKAVQCTGASITCTHQVNVQGKYD